MSYSNKIFEDALNSLREDNRKLANDLEKHVQFGIEFSNIINEMLKYVHDKNIDDYKYFVKMVEKALERKPESAKGKLY